MNIKGIYTNRPAAFQLWNLLVALLLGACISSLLSLGILYIMNGSPEEMTSSPNAMRAIQFVSAIGTFLLPACMTAWLCSHRPADYLSLQQPVNLHTLFLVLASVILFSPTINLTALLNQQMTLPAFMAPIEEWMRQQEALAEQATLALLSDSGIGALIANLIVIALTAAVTEELLFRGTLQRIFSKWTSNHHIIIWSVAILFSAFHLQFYGFIPRMLLGAYFGYLLYWTKSIWAPIFAHFINNAVAVIGTSVPQLSENEYITGEVSEINLLPYSVAALFTLLLFIACVRRIRQLTNLSYEE